MLAVQPKYNSATPMMVFTGQTVVVETCTNLANPAWSPVATKTLTGNSSYFSDPQWSNYPARFYRLRPQ